MTAAATYAALADAANAQRLRLHGEEAPGARWDRKVVQRFTYDPPSWRENFATARSSAGEV